MTHRVEFGDINWSNRGIDGIAELLNKKFNAQEREIARVDDLIAMQDNIISKQDELIGLLKERITELGDAAQTKSHVQNRES
ncbi:MAG: hypothetical protein F4W68_03195 [Cenarchaeum sp. SB0661_bin_35]|nr:hypothetical protein [Cenarchaeum sp. SB0667_bin_13]MXZ94121.1 hypothetical protein [Cenarchaeum sp. SB0666_bin_15]MYB46727.1 hypothetical protein [Cenarchaeum sp. SB0662_bin_33]MYC79492.1 hypothetical protein [Cenarchaeum sp. SB0661_bin_35]MYG32523.1 hypothetical protein [Cenarchaeum sp. SB0677_bin_16]MYI51950.1 hypothetical protein [Cenarchaeum sp. SB0673_bin_9]